MSLTATAGLVVGGSVLVGAAPAAADPTPVAADSFGRTVTGGWGSAEVGGAWSGTGAPSSFAVTGGTGRATMAQPGGGPLAYLNSVSAGDTDETVDVSFDKAPTGGAIYASLAARRTAEGQYFAQVRWMVGGQVNLDLVRIVGSVQTNLQTVKVSGLTLGVGDVIRLRFEAKGASPTTLNAKVWRAGTTEPAGWQNTTTDGSPALQNPGALGLRTYLAGSASNAPVTAWFDNLQAFSGATGGNQPPIAAMTASSKAQSAAFDATSSSDPDGAIATYAWDFGDGSPATTGATVSHSYATPGPYDVRLTVTDDEGAVGFTTRHLVVSDADAVPRPDHIVVLVLENHSESHIIGNPNAPYITSLARSGANMTHAFAEVHPSQPNYLALFSGDTQGISDDSCPHTFGTSSLYDQLASAGLRLTGYSESLPSVGYTGCQSGNYVRKHAPWVNWPSVPAVANQPFSAFPSGDFASLPEVSWVIPNLQNDMHDGTIAQGDSWVAANIGPYVAWANTHNSVLLLTFDEDDNSQNNQIPTIVTGEHVRAGNYDEMVNHYSMLRTIEDAFGVGSLGNSASVAPISDIWTSAANQAPTAAFTSSSSGLTASFDASGSNDVDGAIASYSWNFGDGSAAGSGVSTSHTYGAGGTYPVTLTVTDDKGATASVSHDVTVTPVAGPFAADAFGRTVSDGWGSADVGGPWTRYGTPSNFAVVAGTGQIRLVSPGSGSTVYLNSVSARDIDGTVDIVLDRAPAGGAVYTSLSARRSAAGEYFAQVRWMVGGQVYLDLVRIAGGVQTAMQSVRVGGLTVGVGDTLRLRFQATGATPTSLNAKVWKAATAEPSGWQISTTDGTAGLQSAGAVGVRAYLSGGATNAPVAAWFDNLQVK